MKTKTGSRVGTIFKRVINIRAWADWDRLKSSTWYLVNGIQKLLVPQTNKNSESFDSARVRLKLTDADLFVKQKSLLRLSQLMLLVAFFILVYAGYQLFYGSLKATIISAVVMMLALVLAFRYHFWYFQIKKRKLGCSISQWFKEGLKGEIK